MFSWMKRITALVMAFLMVFGLLPVSFVAAEGGDGTEEPTPSYSEAVEPVDQPDAVPAEASSPAGDRITQGGASPEEEPVSTEPSEEEGASATAEEAPKAQEPEATEASPTEGADAPASSEDYINMEETPSAEPEATEAGLTETPRRGPRRGADGGPR